MTAQKVTLVIDECDAELNQVTQGYVQIAPSARLPDPADMAIVGQAPVTASFSENGPPQAVLVGTDQVGPQPGGWTYSVTYYHVPGVPFGYSWSFYLPYAGGATQRLSALALVPAAQPGAQYLPLPAGTPASGQLPAATGTGEASAWTTLTAAGVGAASTGALAAEVTRATTAEGTLGTAVTTETTRAETAEGTLSTAVSTEMTRAEAAEALRVQLGGQLAGTVTAPQVTAPDTTGARWGVAADPGGKLMSAVLLQAQDGTVLQGQDGSLLGMQDISTTVLPARPYGLAVGGGGCTVPVGQAGHYDDDMQMSSGTSTSMTYRQFWPLSDPQCGAVLPVFAWPLGNPSDQDGTGTLTVACSVECDDGTVLPFYFGGSRTFTITAQDGRLVTADYPIAFGKQATGTGVNGFGTLSGVWLRVYVSQAASRSDSVTTVNGSPTVADTSILATDLYRLVSGTGIPAGCRVGSPLTPGTSFTLVTPGAEGAGYVTVNATASGTVTADISNIIPLNIGANFAAGSLWNGPNGSDLTPQGTVFSGNASFSGAYGPVLLLGRPPAGRVPVVAQVSDSIFNGTTDAFLGPVQRGAIALGYPLVKLSRFGAYASDWSATAGSRYRRKLVPGCTHAIVELGTNDGLGSKAAAAGVQARILAIGAWLSALGVKAWLTTVPPRTTSTDNWATLANQTILYPASVLAFYNGWVRAVPSGFAGYIELGNLVSSAQDSGLWAADGTANYAAADGTHPSAAFMTGPIASAVLSAMSAWTLT